MWFNNSWGENDELKNRLFRVIEHLNEGCVIEIDANASVATHNISINSANAKQTCLFAIGLIEEFMYLPMHKRPSVSIVNCTNLDDDVSPRSIEEACTRLCEIRTQCNAILADTSNSMMQSFANLSYVDQPDSDRSKHLSELMVGSVDMTEDAVVMDLMNIKPVGENDMELPNITTKRTNTVFFEDGINDMLCCAIGCIYYVYTFLAVNN